MSLFIDEDMPLDRIAKKFGISRPTLTTWAKKGNWKVLKLKQRLFDEKLIEARNRLLDELLVEDKNLDQNKIYAIEKIEKLRKIRAKAESPAMNIQTALGIFVEVMREDPQLGPIIEERSEELFKLFTERLETAIAET